MKIVLYGATGKVAWPILNEALARGHQVTAVTRGPGQARFPSHGNLTVEQGDILIGVRDMVGSHDVVISAIGAPKGSDGSLISKAAHALIRGMTRASVQRLLVVGGAGILEVTPGVRFQDTPEYPAAARPASSAHLEALMIYSKSQLNWTVVSPAADFKPGERTGRYRTAAGVLIKDEVGKSRISFEDYAIAMIDEAENPNFLKKHMAVGY